MDTRLVIALAGFVVSLNNRKKRRMWVKQYRRRFGHLPMLRELRECHPEDFKNYLRMDSDDFDCLLALVRPKITKQDTVMRKCITAEERLIATLRFLATGRSYEDLKYNTGLSSSSLSILIPETCKAIYETLLKDYMRFPTSKEEWLAIAKGFQIGGILLIVVGLSTESIFELFHLPILVQSTITTKIFTAWFY